MTRSLARALAIAKPVAKKTIKRRPARIRARRQTTIHQPVRRTERRIKSMGCPEELVCYCICRGPDIGTLMIFCENPTCAIQWYHVSCLKEDIDFDLQWFCSFCRF